VLAAAHGPVHVVDRLIAAGVDVIKACTADGTMLLCAAALFGHVHVMQLLVAAPGVDANKPRAVASRCCWSLLHSGTRMWHKRPAQPEPSKPAGR